jgi:hypothetical protein
MLRAKLPKDSARAPSGTDALQNIEPWSYVGGVLAALFAVGFTLYAITRYHDEPAPRSPELVNEIPVDLE